MITEEQRVPVKEYRQKTMIQSIEEFEGTDMTVRSFNEIFRGSKLQIDIELTVDIVERHVGCMYLLKISNGDDVLNSLSRYAGTEQDRVRDISTYDFVYTDNKGNRFYTAKQAAVHYGVSDTVITNLTKGRLSRKHPSLRMTKSKNEDKC